MQSGTKKAKRVQQGMSESKRALLERTIVTRPVGGPPELLPKSWARRTDEFSRKLLELVDRIQDADAALKAPIPQRLLECGTVSVKEAAEILGCSVEQLEAKERVPRFRIRRALGLQVPCSEVHRELVRARRARVEGLLAEAGRMLRSTTSVRSRWLEPSSIPYPPAYTIADAAKRLGISRAKVKKLVDEDVLFAWSDARGTVRFTQEELDAFKRTYAPALKVAQAA